MALEEPREGESVLDADGIPVVLADGLERWLGKDVWVRIEHFGDDDRSGFLAYRQTSYRYAFSC